MDKIESYEHLFTHQIKDRPMQEGFSVEEYRELVKRIRDWCNKELSGNDKNNKRRSH